MSTLVDMFVVATSFPLLASPIISCALNHYFVETSVLPFLPEYTFHNNHARFLFCSWWKEVISYDNAHIYNMLCQPCITVLLVVLNKNL